MDRLQRDRFVPRLVLGTALLALALKLAIDATTHGTSDIRAFLVFAREYVGSGARVLYEKDPEFNHPPLVLQFLLGLGWLSARTGLRWEFLLRLPAILADFGSVVLLCSILDVELADRAGGRSARIAIGLVAMAPISILVSGFHGNTDPVMLFFTLLSVFWAADPRRTVFAGAAMGLAISIKVVPLAFWPAFFLWLPDGRRRLQYFATAIVVAAACASPFLFEFPGLLADKVIGYSSSFGLWGLSRFATSTPSIGWAADLFRHSGRVLLVGVLVALPIWMNRRTPKPSLYRQLGVITTAFLVFTPGFGTQYLTWALPFVVGLPLSPIVLFLIGSAAFPFLVYVFWSQGVEPEAADPNWLGAEFWRLGFPPDYANAAVMGPWRGQLIPVEWACWITVLVLFYFQVRAARASMEPGRQRSLRPAPVE